MHIHDGILLSHNKEQKLAICNNMVGAGGYYPYWNVKQRKTNTVLFNLCVESEKQNKWTNMINRNSHKYREQIVAREKRGQADERNRWGRLRNTEL